MIGEEQQDAAALYALELLEAQEAAAFEQALQKNAELQALIREMNDSASLLAWESHLRYPPPALKERIQRRLAAPSPNE